jgi:hypothetical protein
MLPMNAVSSAGQAISPGNAEGARGRWERPGPGNFGEEGSGPASPAGNVHPDPYSNGYLTGRIVPRQPAQHRLPLTITGPPRPLCEYAFSAAFRAASRSLP